MAHTRARRAAALSASTLLVATLLACAGAAAMVRGGRVRPFAADVAIWPGVALTVRNGPQGLCHPASRCPRQIGLQPGLSIWLTRRSTGAPAGEAGARRLLFLPTDE